MGKVPLDMKKGTIHKTKNFGSLVIESYINKKTVHVRFTDTGGVAIAESGNIRKNTVKDPMFLSVFGVGYLGQGKYTPKDYPKHYTTWVNMLCRCYCPKSLIKNPTYNGCVVHADWHSFQEFAGWAESNCIDGYALDKDILYPGNKIYSSDTCVYVPQSTNNLTNTNKKARGSLPMGVSWDSKCNKYRAQISINGKIKCLGRFLDIKDAVSAYAKEKEVQLKPLETISKRKGKVINGSFVKE